MGPSTEDERSQTQKMPYRELVGSLAYAAVGSRPDFAFPVGFLSKFLVNPGLEHWRSAIHVLGYLFRTHMRGIRYNRKHSIGRFEPNVFGARGLTMYCDSDYGGDRETSKSVSGQLLTMAGGVVSWRSKLQALWQHRRYTLSS